MAAGRFTPALLAAWRPRLTKDGFVDVQHSCDLSEKLRGELEAMGIAGEVAAVAAGHFVNCQSMGWDLGLLGSHQSSPLLARAAFMALHAWADRQVLAEAA